MANNDVRSRTVTFMAVQSVILGVIMLAFVFLSSVLFVKNATRWQLKNVEEGVLLFARQAARAGEVPKRGDLGPYTFFILAQDGKYILPRLPRSDESENVWREYEHKLVYEMQKRREGWIFYPDDENLRMSDGKYVIRYMHLEEQGWIVAGEGYVLSEWSMLKGFLTPKLFLGLFLVVCLAFGLMLLNAFWHFKKMIKAVLRAQENNFIATSAKPQPEAIFVKREDTALSGGITHGSVDRALPKARPVFAAAEEDLAPEEPVLSVPAVREAERSQTGAKPSHREPAFDPRQFDDLGAVSIDTAEIRSPLLRKVIEEMREEKK